MLKKWDIIRVWRPDLPRPHDKLCICICPRRHWYFYINSDPPEFRRAREVAIAIDNFEVTCLHHKSYIDTTWMVTDLPQKELDEALGDQRRQYGLISPTLQRRIITTVQAHGVLDPDYAAAVIFAGL